MKNILITGFDSFGGETINPSYEAVKAIKDVIGGVRIIKKEIPTEFFRSKQVLIDLINEYNPIAVINVGQAGGRDSISLERYAYNLMNATIPDNAANQPKQEKISSEGPEKMETVIDIETLRREIVSQGIPCSISETAGLFVCNYVMYSMLKESSLNNFVSLFVHVPYSKEQANTKKVGTPFMEISQMASALHVILEYITLNY